MDEVTMRRAIERKRDGCELAAADWESMISAYMHGDVDDAQMSAMAMACVWRGLSTAETVALTRAMVGSGETLRYPRGMAVVDKHSTGGVADIVSLIAVPLVAACGVRVAKLSGRALGHTGGTIDKLEAVPGFRAVLSEEAFIDQVQRVGCAIAAQTDAFVPADKRLYRLRDRTGTVPSMGLIAASIVSKKIAGGAQAFVFDVKCGRAAFMQTPAAAIELAQMLIAVSSEFGKSAKAIVSDMNEPLGRYIGSAIEVAEARDFLRDGGADERLRDVSLHVTATMLEVANVDEPRALAARVLESGAGYAKFLELIEAQGGSLIAVKSLHADARADVLTAQRDGFIGAIDAFALGNVAREWSARHLLGGIRVAVRTGEAVTAGQTLAECYGPGAHATRLQHAFTIANAAPPKRPLIYAVL